MCEVVIFQHAGGGDDGGVGGRGGGMSSISRKAYVAFLCFKPARLVSGSLKFLISLLLSETIVSAPSSMFVHVPPLDLTCPGCVSLPLSVSPCPSLSPSLIR